MRVLMTVVLGPAVLFLGAMLLTTQSEEQEPRLVEPKDSTPELPVKRAVEKRAAEKRTAESSLPDERALEDALDDGISQGATPDQLRGSALPEEGAIMAQLRELMLSDPSMSLSLARAGNEAYADTPHAPERHWFEARALVELRRFEEAQEVARRMVDDHPESHWAQDARRHLLSHPFGEAPRLR